MKEYQIENALLELFNLSGYFAFKNFDQSAYREGSYRKHKWQIRGIADVTMLTPIGVVYVEVKTPKGKQSEYQTNFEKQCVANGIVYRICRSVEDGRKLLGEIREWITNSRKL